MNSTGSSRHLPHSHQCTQTVRVEAYTNAIQSQLVVCMHAIIGEKRSSVHIICLISSSLYKIVQIIHIDQWHYLSRPFDCVDLLCPLYGLPWISSTITSMQVARLICLGRPPRWSPTTTHTLLDSLSIGLPEDPPYVVAMWPMKGPAAESVRHNSILSLHCSVRGWWVAHTG